MPNFISEDDIEQAMLQHLQHSYATTCSTMRCTTANGPHKAKR